MRTLPFSCIFPKHGNNGRSQTGWNLMSENGYLSEADPLWYKDAVIYEVPVRAFFDSDGDGVGDLRGLTEKLDYIQDLGVTAIWLPPFYPSPLKDDGYDIVDYRGVHPAYGTLQDFRRLIHEAHDRGLRIITELVINHTSDQHPWFQRARRVAPGSRWRDFYVWSDRPDRFQEARVIFQDFETSNWAWDPVAQAYYWHRFYSHQPDLNFRSAHVRRAVLQVMDFWLDMGVDGMRLDAIPYLYEQEGTSCENLPETHAFFAGAPPAHGAELSGPHAASRSQPMARRSRLLLRKWGRVPHVLLFPAHAPPLHGAAH